MKRYKGLVLKIIFQSGDSLRCLAQTAFVVDGKSKQAKHLVAGDKVGNFGEVNSVTRDGKMRYFIT